MQERNDEQKRTDNDADDDTLLLPKEAAAKLRISLDTLEGLVADGELPIVDVGRGKQRARRMFDRRDIENFIEQRKRRKPCTTSTRRRRKPRASGKRGNVVTLAQTKDEARHRRLMTPFKDD